MAGGVPLRKSSLRLQSSLHCLPVGMAEERKSVCRPETFLLLYIPMLREGAACLDVGCPDALLHILF